MLSSENVIFRTLHRTVGARSERLKVNVMLRHLEFDDDTSEHSVDDEMSPHEEVEEMERWRGMYDGYEFYDYMHDFKKIKREEVIMARRTEMQIFKKMGSMSRCRAKMRDSMAARSLPASGSIRTKEMIKTQTTEAGWWTERSNAISGWIFFLQRHHSRH